MEIGSKAISFENMACPEMATGPMKIIKENATPPRGPSRPLLARKTSLSDDRNQAVELMKTETKGPNALDTLPRQQSKLPCKVERRPMKSSAAKGCLGTSWWSHRTSQDPHLSHLERSQETNTVAYLHSRKATQKHSIGFLGFGCLPDVEGNPDPALFISFLVLQATTIRYPNNPL